VDSNLEPVKKRILAQVWSYILAGLTGILGVFNWLAIRELQRLVVVFSGITVWAWRAIDQFTFIFLGIIWLCLVYFSQNYYEKGFWNKKMLKRFSILTVIQAVILFLAYFAAHFIRIRYGIQS